MAERLDNDLIPESSRKRRRSGKSSPGPAQKKANSRKITPTRTRISRAADAEVFETAAIGAYESDSSRKGKAFVPGGSNVVLEVEAQLCALRESLEEVEDQLRLERSQRTQQERQIRQDMLLEMLQANDTAQRDKEKLERHLRTASRLIEEKEQTIIELQMKSDSTTASLARQIAEADHQRQDLQHLQSINTTLEGDIEELRQIHNEGPASQRPPGLPPAYGSLCEEDLEPYLLHKDSGALTIASLKRAARECFHKEVDDILYNGKKTALAEESAPSPGVRRFFAASSGLYQASLLLDKTLRAHEGGCSLDVLSADGSSVQRESLRKSSMASRIASLILDLGWRVVAINEVRPYHRTFSNRASALLRTMYSQIDSVFLEAIRQWNGESDGGQPAIDKNCRAVEFQFYLSQVTVLKAKIMEPICQSSNKWSSEVFGKSAEYLQEAVESERTQQANRLSQDAEIAARQRRGVSVISSEGIPEEDEEEIEWSRWGRIWWSRAAIDGFRPSPGSVP